MKKMLLLGQESFWVGIEFSMVHSVELKSCSVDTMIPYAVYRLMYWRIRSGKRARASC